MHPPVDGELSETAWPMLLDQWAGVATLTEEEFQKMVVAGAAGFDPDLRRDGAVRVRELTVPAADGRHELPALVLTPATGEGPFPCVYYTANGGKMGQNTRLALTDTEARWVAEHGIAFVSIAPRVGPEHRHPAQVEDAYAGLVWIVENAAELGVDVDRVMVMGKSGGGGIAAATALLARDRGGPALSHQILVCPMIDDRAATVSSAYDVPPWTSANNAVGWRAILGDAAGGADVSPYAAVARADDLAGLPPAYLEVGSSEVFRDEVLDYAARLARAGVPTELHSWVGGFHSFEIFAPDTTVSRACLAARTSYLERALRASAERP